ncbi:hypothetical protein C0J52_27107 [Blattella germanica]|nr:hypothetical protein C0J52_27107 [Blattella germanica]
MLGIPFFADQRFNARKMELSGIGLTISFEDLSNNSLLKAINELLYNSKYKKSMLKMSTLSMDEPETPIERLIWWTEYVVRHKGTTHMRSAALDLEWYQYLLLDIVVFLLLIFLIIIFILYHSLRLIYKYLLKVTAMKSKND